MKSKNKIKFTPAYDNHIKLKGKQSKLPDVVQEAIINSSMKKLSALTKRAGHMSVSGGLEGRMAKRQLFEISEMAQELFNQIDDHDDLQEWCQVKIATIHDRLHSVHSYMAYNNRFPKMASKGCGCNDCEDTVKLAGVKKKFQNPEGGLNAKGRAYFKRTQGSNLKRPVSALQARNSPKAAGRRRSFCARMGGMRNTHNIDCRANPDKDICKALRKWDC